MRERCPRIPRVTGPCAGTCAQNPVPQVDTSSQSDAKSTFQLQALYARSKLSHHLGREARNAGLGRPVLDPSQV